MQHSTVYAFIDSQNLNLGVLELGWTLDFARFRIYLKERYHVVKAFLFVGYLPGNEILYRFLEKSGYLLVFKPTLQDKKGVVKGNVDADLVLRAMIEFDRYDQAIIVSSDGDFYSLVNYLYDKDKLRLVISPNHKKCSALLKRSAREKIVFMNNLKQKLSYQK